MPFTPQDEPHLLRALTLAQQALALASPNPTVGCVLTRNNTPIAEGAHLYDHRDHAEIAALKQAALNPTSFAFGGSRGLQAPESDSPKEGALAPEAAPTTAYVTLEPCAHHGRTGPCADALIAAGITRCVIATLDPNPLVRGNGLAKLRAAHIDTVLLDPTHPLAQQARRLNDAFAHSIQHHRPFVTLKAALSVDGMLAPPPATRTTTAPHWLTGTAARSDAQLLRHAADAILTGIGTVLADNPSLTDRSGLPRRRPLLRIVLDTHLRTPLTSTLVQTAANDLLIVCAETAPAEREAALTAAGAEVLRIDSKPQTPNPKPLSETMLDLNSVIEALHTRHILNLLVEAGSALNTTLLRANLVDKAVLYYADRELGTHAVPFAAGFGSPYELQRQLTSTTRTTFPTDLPPHAEDIRITGYLHDPWASIA
jgi:diaminohydroxyphosphoribosylaminopyrimidine deaminase/5-amino-6-(5-phosphoribosylamino)uracil reductase